MPPRYSEEEARAAIAGARSWNEALRTLRMRPAGGNWKTLQRYAREWDIPVDHFDPYASMRERPNREPTPLAEILVEGSTYSRGHLKARLYAEGVKRPECELCGQGEVWMGKPISLILDHVNGVGDDNRIENLQIVCPNCAATLATHCGRNKPQTPVTRDCLRCGAAFVVRRAGHRYCSPACGRRHPRPRGPQDPYPRTNSHQ